MGVYRYSLCYGDSMLSTRHGEQRFLYFFNFHIVQVNFDTALAHTWTHAVYVLG